MSSLESKRKTPFNDPFLLLLNFIISSKLPKINIHSLLCSKHCAYDMSEYEAIADDKMRQHL